MRTTLRRAHTASGDPQAQKQCTCRAVLSCAEREANESEKRRVEEPEEEKATLVERDVTRTQEGLEPELEVRAPSHLVNSKSECRSLTTVNGQR